MFFASIYVFLLSHPVWGAWIEICLSIIARAVARASHPVWGAWIEIMTKKSIGRS